MTNRFIRNLAGVTAVTGLALALACGGSSSSNDTPVTPPVVGPTVTKPTPGIVMSSAASGYTKHTYPFQILSVGADQYQITATSATPSTWQASNTVDYKIPDTAGELTLYIHSKNDGGTAVNTYKFTAALDVPPTLPDEVATTGVNVNTNSADVASITFAKTAKDGDPVTWSGFAKPANFPGDWNWDPETYVLTIKAPEEVEEEEELDGEWTSSATYIEKYRDKEVSTDTYSFKISFSDKASTKVIGTGGGGTSIEETVSAKMTSPPGDDYMATVGVPWRYQFRATDNNRPDAQTIDWITFNANDPQNVFPVLQGTWDLIADVNSQDEESSIFRHDLTWIRNYARPNNNTRKGEGTPDSTRDARGMAPFNEWQFFGPRWEVFRAFYINDHARIFKGPGDTGGTAPFYNHQLWFTPSEAYEGLGHPYVNMGVAAKFYGSAPGAIVDHSFYINVKENEGPVPGTVTKSSVNFTVYTEMFGKTWFGGETGEKTYSNWDVVTNSTGTAATGGWVLRADEAEYPHSMDLSAKISFTVPVDDADFAPAPREGSEDGDLVTCYLKEIYASTNTTTPSTAAFSIKSQLVNGKYLDRATMVLLEKDHYLYGGNDDKEFGDDVTWEKGPYHEDQKNLDWIANRFKTNFSGTIGFREMPSTGGAKGITFGTSGANTLGLAADGTPKLDYIHFVFEVEDLGENPATFVVIVPVRGNTGPHIDGIPDYSDVDRAGFEPHSGDDKKRYNAAGVWQKGWVNTQPAEEFPSQWELNWSSNGKVLEDYRVSDASYVDDTLLWIRRQPYEVRGYEGGAPVYITPKNGMVGSEPVLNAFENGWTIDWKPNEFDARKEYTFEICGWDMYGAAVVDHKMEGVVFGNIYGEKVSKNIYRSEYVLEETLHERTGTLTWGTDWAYADFGNIAWAGVKVDPFFDHTWLKDRTVQDINPKSHVETTIYHAYYSDVNGIVDWSAGGRNSASTEIREDNNRWKAFSVPPVSYLVSSGYRDGRFRVVTGPVVGPAVLSTDGLVQGDVWGVGEKMKVKNEEISAEWTAGNRAPFAWLGADSHTPDLTTYVGSNKKAIDLDTTIHHYANHGAAAESYFDPTDYSHFATTYPFGQYSFAHGPNDHLVYSLFDGFDRDLGQELVVDQIVIAGSKANGLWGYWGQDFLIDGGTATEDEVAATPLKGVLIDDMEVNVTMAGVIPSAYNFKTDAIQFVWPTVGTTAFFSLDYEYDSADPTAIAYPTNHYPATPWWTANLGQPTFGPVEMDPANGYYISDWDKSIYNMIFNLSPATRHIMSAPAGKHNPVSLSTLRYDTKRASGVVPTGYNDAVGFPYWRMEASGIVQPRNVHQNYFDDPGELTDQISNWGNVDSMGSYNLGIQRSAFINAHRYGTPVPMVAGDLDAIRDTFRVLAYVHGTELGPVENEFGVPVYLEFGDININTPIEATALVSTTTDENLWFGGFPIPKPQANYWDAGGTTPVATYTYNYIDANSGLSATAGYVRELKDTDSGTTVAVTAGPQITNLRISTGSFDKAGSVFHKDNNSLFTLPSAAGTVALNTATLEAQRELDVTQYITTKFPNHDFATLAAARAAGAMPNAVVNVLPYQASSDAQPKVWLAWTNPTDTAAAPAYSGHIFEFFSVATGADLTDRDVPIYKVYMGRGQDRFPIPDAWLRNGDEDWDDNELITLGTAGRQVVIRVRTVKYGSGAETSETFINMNKSPWKQALPATWTETISTRLNFAPARTYLEGNRKWSAWEAKWVEDESYLTWTPSNTTIYLINLPTSTSLFAAAPTVAINAATGIMPYDPALADYGSWTAYETNTAGVLSDPVATLDGLTFGTPGVPGTLTMDTVTNATLYTAFAAATNGKTFWYTHDTLEYDTEAGDATKKIIVGVTVQDIEGEILTLTGVDSSADVEIELTPAATALAIGTVTNLAISHWTGVSVPAGFALRWEVTAATKDGGTPWTSGELTAATILNSLTGTISTTGLSDAMLVGDTATVTATLVNSVTSAVTASVTFTVKVVAD